MIGKKRVVIGLSGGVDSSVAAALLIEQGCEISGVYLECYNEPGCRTDQDKSDALKVALKLGIPFQVLDFRKEYKEKVVEYFYREYQVGRTPNPDVMCNREIKFGIFYDWAMEQGYDYAATGHYARIVDLSGVSRKALQMARDVSKDQSYFLWQIPRDHLEQILFPLGEMLKSEVREKARSLGLLTAEKPDSMGICFIGEVNVNQLLENRLGENPGDVVMMIRSELGKQGSELCTIGAHRGLWFYTIGERGGFEVDKKKLKMMGLHPEKMGPLYVIGKNMTLNQLVVGVREETMRSQLRINSQIINPQILKLENKLWVRIRNLGELTEVESVISSSNEEMIVKLKDKIFGIAEGQSCVFYDEQKVLVGGGIIV